MAKIEFGDHQCYTLTWAITASLVMLAAALVSGWRRLSEAAPENSFKVKMHALSHADLR